MDYDKLRNKIKQMTDKPKRNLDVTDWYLKGKLDAYIEMFDEEFMWDSKISIRDRIEMEISLEK